MEYSELLEGKERNVLQLGRQAEFRFLPALYLRFQSLSWTCIQDMYHASQPDQVVKDTKNQR